MKQRLVCFHIQLNESSDCSKSMLVVLEIVPKLCFKNTKLLHSLEYSFVSGLDSSNRLSHARRIASINTTMCIDVSADVAVAPIAFVGESSFMREMQFVLQFESKDLGIRIGTTSVGSIDVNNS